MKGEDAQLGLNPACIDDWVNKDGNPSPGGTCLNVGCIPSKALLHASHQLHEAEHNFAKMGLKGKSPSVDWKQMLAYKDDVIGQNTKGVEFLFKKNKIDWLKGWGSNPAAGQVKVFSGEPVEFMEDFSIPFAGKAIAVLLGMGAENWRQISHDASDLGLAMGVECKRHEAVVNAACDRLTDLARDLVRNIQDLRKEAGLEVQDRIRLSLDAPGEAAAKLEELESVL